MNSFYCATDAVPTVASTAAATDPPSTFSISCLNLEMVSLANCKLCFSCKISDWMFDLVATLSNFFYFVAGDGAK